MRKPFETFLISRFEEKKINNIGTTSYEMIPLELNQLEYIICVNIRKD